MEGSFLDLWRRRVEKTPDAPAMLHSVAGRWESLSWGQVDLETDVLAHGLLALGLQAFDRVAIFSRSRVEWVLADLATLKASASTVPVHLDAAPGDIEHTIRDSGSRFIFVQDEKEAPRIRHLLQGSNIQKIILMAGPASGQAEIRWSEIMAAGRSHQAEFPNALSEMQRRVGPESLASIVYTAGTTGKPKGVMLVHDNFVFETESLQKVMTGIIDSRDVHLLCLPLSHILARVLLLASVPMGYCTAFSSGLDNFYADLLEVRPTFVTVVPGILERVHSTLVEHLEKTDPLSRRVVEWATRLGGQIAERRRRRVPPSVALSLVHGLAERLVLKKLVKTRLGGKMKFFICGGAPLSPEIASWMERLGVLVLEGYGLTENTGAANVNRPDRYLFGSVGPPIPEVEEKIAADGEILIRGRNVMRGYHGMPEASADALDQDGWLHTGDIGFFDQEGFLHVTDRKKDIIVTSGGKNVSPQNIEKLMRTSIYIDQIMVCGDERPYLTALVSLDREQIQRYAEREGIAFDRLDELAAHPAVRRLIAEEIEQRNRQLAGFETIRRFAILPEPFSLNDGEITPTFKLRRSQIEARYGEIIESLYREDAAAGQNLGGEA